MTVLDAHFDGEDGFSYLDDPFRGTSEPSYASGIHVASGGYTGGALRVTLGGNGDSDITDMSGGWQISFSGGVGELELFFRYKLQQSPDYESDEVSQALASFDGSLLADLGSDYVAQVNGNGNGSALRSTGWREFRADLGSPSSGPHTLIIGGYNSKKTLADEITDIWVDDVRIATPAAPGPNLSAQTLVDSLDLARFKSNIQFLSSPSAPINGSRHWTQNGNPEAVDWIVSELEAFGYTNVVRHPYSYQGSTRYNVYATKVGTLHPEEMYVVSAHLDSKTTDGSGNAAAAGADDDASGTSLVLEAARVFAPMEVTTVYSIRFAFWNNEETGLNGSGAYVNDFVADQAIQNPPGSGLYPEPLWRGMLQHDMILYDHGLPPQPTQIAAADIDIEYKSSATYNGFAIDLANRAAAGNGTYATDYPSEVTNNMSNTDSANFQNHTGAISLRENRRLAELGNGSNPNYHTFMDVYGSYSDLDYLFGFNVAQTTVGTVAQMAGASTCADADGDQICDAQDPCPSYANVSLQDSDGDGIPDECQCGDYNGDGIVNSTDLVPMNNCVSDNRLCDQSIIDCNNDGVTMSVDIALANTVVNGAPAYTLECGRRPEGTPPP